MATGKLFPFAGSKLVLSDTNIHSYRVGDVFLLDILNTIPRVANIGFYVFNNTNVPVEFTPLLNIFPDKSLPDVALTTTTVDAGNSSFISISSEYFIANYFSLQVQATSTPKGSITGFAIINYDYTIR